MKRIFISATLLLAISGHAQQKIISQAIVKSKTEMTFPENPGGGPGGAQDVGGDRVMILGGPGGGGMESSNTFYFKPDWVKIASESDFGNNTVIIDRKNKKTTTLIEAMGRKTGFYTTEEDEEAIRKNMQARMDSVRKARGEATMTNNNPPPSPPEISYVDGSKKIAGFNCKKAIIKSPNRQGEVTETTVWYCPEFKMAEGYPLGGGRNGRGMGGGPFGSVVAGLDKIDGFPMAYEFARPNGFKMNSEVTKIEIDAPIEDKIFEIPKGFEVKALKDMQGPGGPGTFDIRIGGPPGGG